MAFTYKLQAPDGQIISFDSEQQLTESQAQQTAANIYDQQKAEQAQLEETAAGWRNPLEFAADTALGLGKGLLGLGATAGDVTSLLGAEEAGMGISDMFRAGQEKLGELKSEEMQAREKLFRQELASMQGEGAGTEFATAVGHLITNPSLLLDMATEQVPQLLPIAKAGKGARALMETALPKATEKTLSRAGIAGAGSAAAVMQGSDIGMQTYDRVYDEYKKRGASDEEAAMVAIDEARQDALQAGLVTLGTTAMIPGAAAVEKALVGGATSARTAAGELKKLARTRAATKATLGEAAQEGLEEGSGAYISNISAIEAGADIDPMQGVGTQAGIGSVLGGAFGLPAGIVQGGRDVQEVAQQRLLDQAVADAQAKREQGVQMTLPGIPEVAGPPVPTAEQAAEAAAQEFTLDQQDMGAPQQLEMDLEQPAEAAPTAAETGQLSLDLDMRSDEERRDALQDQLKNFDENYPKDQFKPKERGEIRRGIEKELAAINKSILAKNSATLQQRVDAEREAQMAEDSAFADAQPDLFGEIVPPKEPSIVEPTAEPSISEDQLGLEFGPPAINRADLNLGGLPARETKTYTAIEDRLAGLYLANPEDRAQIQQIADELGNMPQKWATDLATYLEGRLQVTENLAQDTLAQRDQAAAAETKRRTEEFAPELEKIVGEAVETGLTAQEEVNYQENIRIRESLGLPVPPPFELVADNFVADQVGPQIPKDLQLQAADLINQYDNVLNNMRDKDLAAQLDARGKQLIGNKAWGQLKGNLTKLRNAKIKAMRQEISGRIPEGGQFDMFAQQEKQTQRSTRKADKTLRKVAKTEVTQPKTPEQFKADQEASAKEQAAIEAAIEQDRINAEQKAEIDAYNDKFNKALKRSAKGKGAAKVMDGDYVYRGYQIQRTEDGVWNVGEIKDGKPATEFDDAADTLTDAKAIVDNYIEPEVVEDDVRATIREAKVRGRVRGNDNVPASKRGMEVVEPTGATESTTTEAPVPPESGGMADTTRAAGGDTGTTSGKPVALAEPIIDIIESFDAAMLDPSVENTREFILGALEQKLISADEATKFRQESGIGKKTRMGLIATIAKRMGDKNFFEADPKAALAVHSATTATVNKVTKEANERMERDVEEALGGEQELNFDDEIPYSRGPFEDHKHSTVAQLENAVGKLIRRLRGTIDVKIVQSRSDLPEGIDAPAGTKGVYHNGVAYVVADNTPLADVETVIAHETVGHAGLETILGKDGFNNLLKNINAIAGTNPRIKSVLENIKRMYTDPQGNYNLSPREEAMEILAHIAEAKTELLTDNAIRRVWNTAVQMFRRAMARLGFIDPADVTIDQLIHEAALHMQGGKHINRDRYFMRHDYMAAHTMQRAWDMGFRGFDLAAAGAHIKGVANGSIQVPAITEDTIFGQDIDHDFIDRAVFSRGPAVEPTEEVDQDTKDIIASRGRPAPVPTGMAAKLREVIRGRGAVGAARRGVDYIRVMMFDSAATIEDKLMKSYNNAMAKDGFINPMVPYVQALRAEGMAMQVLRSGSLRVDENGLWEAVKVDGVSSMHDVFNELKILGERIGADAAQDLFHAVTIAQRELEIEQNNRDNQAEADRIRAAGGKNAAANAKKIEEKIVNLHPGKDEAWQSARDAENKRIVAKFEQYPELRRAHDHFLSTKDSLIDTLVDVGFFSKEKGEELKDAIGYVPFNRLLEDGEGGGYDAHSTGLMRVGSLGTLNGSLLEVDNILDNMTKKVVWMTQTAMRVRAANELIRGLSDEAVDGIQGFYDYEESIPEAEKAGLITYYKDGKLKYATTKDKLDAFAFRGNETIALPLLRMLANATDWLRKGITLSPEFIIGQWQQDSVRAYALGGTKNGLKTAGKVTSSYAKIRKSLWDGNFGDENLNRYGIQGMYDATTEHNKELIDAQIDPTKKRGMWKKLIDFGEHNAEASDLAQRKAVYDQTIAETGDAVLAFWRASEVINFNRRGAGKTASVLRQLIPFQNAYFQGMNVLLKAMFNRGLQQSEKSKLMPLFWGSMTKLFVLNFMYAMAMADDDEYKNQPDYIRSRYLAIPIGDGLNVKWAMPADLGFFFKAIPEAIAMGIGGEADSKKIANFLGHSMWEAMAGPSALPQFGKPLIEAATNRNFFTEGPIVSQGMMNRKVEDRYNESTSQFARMLGKSGLISPLMADHLIKGFTGTLGGTALTVSDLAVETAFGIDRTDRQLADYPITKALFTRTYPTGFKQDFYALRKNMREVYGSYKAALDRGDIERAMEIFKDDPKLIQLRAQINNVDKSIKDSNARIKKYQNSKMSSEEKRRLIDIERERQSRLSSQISRMRRYAYD